MIAEELDVESIKSFRLVHSRFNTAMLMVGLKVNLTVTNIVAEEQCERDNVYCRCYYHVVDWNEKRLNNLLKSNRLPDVVTLLVEIPWVNTINDITVTQRLSAMKETIKEGRTPRMTTLSINVLPTGKHLMGADTERNAKKAIKEFEEFCHTYNITTFFTKLPRVRRQWW